MQKGLRIQGIQMCNVRVGSFCLGLLCIYCGCGSTLALPAVAWPVLHLAELHAGIPALEPI